MATSDKPVSTVTSAPLAVASMRPTHTTVYWRTSVIWQLLRFAIINLRITRMILRSHETHLRGFLVTDLGPMSAWR
jgi:hypothetical protein